MKIGVVSDTHSKELPKQMVDDFKKTDMIFHVGDFCSVDVLLKLEKINKVQAVYGNMDGADLRKILPKSQVVEHGKFRIGLFHGEGSERYLLDRVIQEFKNKKVDAIVFGHSHHPINESINGILFFNPGSATDTIFAPYCSYGILEIDDKIQGRIIKIQ